jgi:hypothetical protein
MKMLLQYTTYTVQQNLITKKKRGSVASPRCLSTQTQCRRRRSRAVGDKKSKGNGSSLKTPPRQVELIAIEVQAVALKKGKIFLTVPEVLLHRPSTPGLSIVVDDHH